MIRVTFSSSLMPGFSGPTCTPGSGRDTPWRRPVHAGTAHWFAHLRSVDCRSGGRGGFTEDRLARRPPGQRRLGRLDAARHRLDPTEADARRGDDAAFYAQHDQGHRQRIIAGAATELLET